jgi:hypothetical protein
MYFHEHLARAIPDAVDEVGEWIWLERAVEAITRLADLKDARYQQSIGSWFPASFGEEEQD